MQISLTSHCIGYIYIYLNRLIGLVGRVFANGLGERGSIPGQVIPKTLEMVLDTSLLNTQQYKVRIKSKVEQSRERSRALPLYLGVVAIEKGTLLINLSVFLKKLPSMLILFEWWDGMLVAIQLLFCGVILVLFKIVWCILV